MNPSFRQFVLDSISGQRRGLAASLYRAAASAATIPYGAVVRVRNALYDHDVLNRHALGRPTISVGNLTTGGTGKTPVVAWLTETLASRGQRVAVLMRGYGARDPQQCDEACELRLRFDRLAETADLHGHPARAVAAHDRPAPGLAVSDRPSIQVLANPNRVHAAQQALQQRPELDAFVLDDGFQHRRARRDVDLVLIDATSPFGFGRLLPRGLLREPIRSLRRADAVILTRCDLVESAELARIVDLVRVHCPGVSVFRSRHVLGRLSDGRTLESLHGRPVDVFCGIGNPDAFRAMLSRAGVNVARFEAFNDHRNYTDDELRRLATTRSAGACDHWLTTMKDLARLGPRAEALPAVAVTMSVSFEEDDGSRLVALIDNKLDWSRRSTSSPTGRNESR